MISGTDHHAIRIFDIHTLKCYIPQHEKDHHESGITRVRYAPMANIFSSSSHDGSIKIYDGVSSSCVNTIQNAHGGQSVTSVAFSKSGKYLLSTGMDHEGKLWDMSTGKVVITYAGGIQRVLGFNDSIPLHKWYFLIMKTISSAQMMKQMDLLFGMLKLERSSKK